MHGLWNTGEQKVLFRKDPQGLCPCCKTIFETTNHVFQCLEPGALQHRQCQLDHIADYLDKQELPKSVKEWMYAGITSWIASAVNKPPLLAPTIGKLMPVDQMATAASSDQTSIGWDAFLRGQISSLWRKTILYASSIRDEDATETHLRRIIRKLHSFSLALWEYRNGILHGTTRDERREIRSSLIRAKVVEAYELQGAGRFPLLARDASFFNKKHLDRRPVERR